MIDSRTLNAMRRLKTEYDGLFQNLNLTNNLGVGFALINSDDIFNWRLDYMVQEILHIVVDYLWF